MSMLLPFSTSVFSWVEVGVFCGAPSLPRICVAVIRGKASTTCWTVIDPLTSAGAAGAATPVPDSAQLKLRL